MTIRWPGLMLTIGLGLLPMACADEAPSAEEMAELTNATQYVASAVRAEVRFGSAGPDAAGGDLLAAVHDRNASLLAPFTDYNLQARAVGGRSSVLVCDAAGEHALMEDAGCTQQPDAPDLWTTETPCAFQLDLAAVCGTP